MAEAYFETFCQLSYRASQTLRRFYIVFFFSCGKQGHERMCVCVMCACMPILLRQFYKASTGGCKFSDASLQ